MTEICFIFSQIGKVSALACYTSLARFKIIRFKALNEVGAPQDQFMFNGWMAQMLGKNTTAPYRIIMELNYDSCDESRKLITYKIFTCKSAKIRTEQKKKRIYAGNLVFYRRWTLFVDTACVFRRHTWRSSQCVLSVFFHDSVQTGWH